MSARDQELWDAIVFDAYDNPTASTMHLAEMQSLPLEERRTLVMYPRAVTSFRICIQSAEASEAGERLERFTDVSWWTQEIERFSGQRWAGNIEVSTCTDEPPNAWVHVREGREGEVRDGFLGHTVSWRYADAHGVLSEWDKSEIVLHSAEAVNDASEDALESLLAHELGHVLGFWHAPSGSGFLMESSSPAGRPDAERRLAQLAYEVGPNVQYPGLVRPTGTEPGDLKGGVKDLVDEALDELNDDSNGRQAAESVPALPAAGVLLLALLLGLFGRRRLRAR